MFIFPVGLVQNLDKSLKIHHSDLIVVKTSKITFFLLLCDFEDLVDSGLKLIERNKTILIGIELVESVVGTDFFVAESFLNLRIELIHLLDIKLFYGKEVGFYFQTDDFARNWGFEAV